MDNSVLAASPPHSSFVQDLLYCCANPSLHRGVTCSSQEVVISLQVVLTLETNFFCRLIQDGSSIQQILEGSFPTSSLLDQVVDETPSLDHRQLNRHSVA